MFDIISPMRSGFLGLDGGTEIEKFERGLFLTGGAHVLREKTNKLTNFEVNFLVEPGNALFWKHSQTGQLAPRGAWGSWSFALPARKVDAALAISPGLPINQIFQPLGTHSTVDDDFEKLPVHVLGGQKVPVGADAVVFATAGHGTHDKVALVAGVSGPLIAHWRGQTPPEFSTHVHDITGKSVDQVRHAGLDTIFEVRKWAAPCSGTSTSSAQEYTIALNGRASPEGKGFLHVSFGDHDALFSFMASGPLIPSFHKKHGLVHTGDAPLSAGAISTLAYYRGSKMPFTAPLAFEEELYPPVLNGEIPYEVHRQYDGSITHAFLCGPRQGQWREFVKLPLGETPPCEATKDHTALDANSNVQRTFAPSRVFFTKTVQVAGIYFTPRPNILNGRRP